MKTNKYINGIAVAMLGLGLGSCASDYLDTPQHGNVNADEICKTTELAHQAAVGACQGLSGVWDYDLLYQFLGSGGETALSTFYGEYVGSDAYSNFFLEANPDWDFFYKMNNSMGYGTWVWDSKTWVYAYAMIAQCNEIIDGIDGAEGDEAERNFVKGEVYTLRAHCYWRLLQAYAPRWDASNNGEVLSVVLRTSPADPQEKPLSTMKEVLDQCYADLDIAVASFKAAGNYKRTLTYEPNLNVAYGVYARVAALRNDWAKVKEMAHNAQSGLHYSTPESLFAGFGSYVDGEWMWCNSFNLTVDNHIYSNWSTWYACNGYGARLSASTTRINRTLYDQIPTTDTRRNLWFTWDKISDDPAPFYASKNVTQLNQNIGSRKERRAAIAWIADHNAPGYSDAYTQGEGKDAQQPVICDGAQLKFFCQGDLGQNGISFPPYMRASEMFLLEAEACAMLGQTGEAQAILNSINKQYDPEYNCTKSGQDLIDEVRLYTRVELWGEGFCWYNLKRWGLPLYRKAWVADDPTSGNLPPTVACNVGPNEANLWRYGIPRAETNYNSAVTYPYEGNGPTYQ